MMMAAFIALSVLWLAVDFKELKRRGAKYAAPYAVIILISYVLFFFAEYTDFNFAELVF